MKVKCFMVDEWMNECMTEWINLCYQENWKIKTGAIVRKRPLCNILLKKKKLKKKQKETLIKSIENERERMRKRIKEAVRRMSGIVIIVRPGPPFYIKTQS